MFFDSGKATQGCLQGDGGREVYQPALHQGGGGGAGEVHSRPWPGEVRGC